jgi:hypothetical protein
MLCHVLACRNRSIYGCARMVYEPKEGSKLGDILCVLLSLWNGTVKRRPLIAVIAPANEAVEYETVVFRRGFGTGKSPYQGYPTEAHDALWDDLYQCQLSILWVGNLPKVIKDGVRLHIDEEQAWQLPNKTVGIPGLPDQYVIGLDVFHQLHCVVHLTWSCDFFSS